MSILKIARLGHPVLATKAAPVEDPTAPQVKAIVEDMIETLFDTPGNGLAAPQVHIPLRIVIFFLAEEAWSYDRGDEPPARRNRRPSDSELQVPLTVLINPEYSPLGDEMMEGYEGCLSVPGLTGKVRRHRHIRYRGTTPSGELLERTASDAHAQVVQHECDHLDGIVYLERIADLKQLTFVSELALHRGG